MTHPGQLLKQEKLYAGKELGQNFLNDPALAEMIVERTGIGKRTRVLEIGPGLGALTIPIAAKAASVTAVEKDRRLIPLLTGELDSHGVENVTVLNQDILKTDIEAIAGGDRICVFGNLPYNISSQILFKLVKLRRVVDSAFLMFQRELAERIKAGPGGRDYSRLSAVVQYACDIRFVAHIKPNSFFPRPDVDSTVLRFDFFKDTGFDPENEPLLFAVIKAAFSKRRKTLNNSMTGGELGLSKPQARTVLEQAVIDPERRAETLSVNEFIALAESVGRIL